MTTTNNTIRMNVTLVEAGRHDAENYYQLFVFDGCENVEEMFDAVEFAIWDRLCETYPGLEEARCFGDIVNAGQNDQYGRPGIIETEFGVFDIGYAYDPDDLEAELHAEGFTVEDVDDVDPLDDLFEDYMLNEGGDHWRDDLWEHCGHNPELCKQWIVNARESFIEDYFNDPEELPF